MGRFLNCSYICPHLRIWMWEGKADAFAKMLGLLLLFTVDSSNFPIGVPFLCRLGTNQLSGGHLRWNFYASYSLALYPGSLCHLDPCAQSGSFTERSSFHTECENHVGPAGWLQRVLLEWTTKPTNQQLSNPHGYLGSSTLPSLRILPYTGQESRHSPFWEVAYCFLSLGRWGRIWPSSWTEQISPQNSNHTHKVLYTFYVYDRNLVTSFTDCSEVTVLARGKTKN